MTWWMYFLFRFHTILATWLFRIEEDAARLRDDTIRLQEGIASLEAQSARLVEEIKLLET